MMYQSKSRHVAHCVTFLSDPPHMLSMLGRRRPWRTIAAGRPATASIGKSRRWSAQRTLDEAVAAVHRGAADRAIALAEGSALQTYFKCNRAVFLALLALMIGRGDGTMLDYVREKLLADPGLAQERY